MGYHRAACLHPRADPDRARRGRPIRNGEADRGRARGVLLPGRGCALAGRPAFAATRHAGDDAQSDFGFRWARLAREWVDDGGVMWPPHAPPVIAREYGRSSNHKRISLNRKVGGYWIPA